MGKLDQAGGRGALSIVGSCLLSMVYYYGITVKL